MIREEKDFRFRFSLEAQFPETYVGEADAGVKGGEMEFAGGEDIAAETGEVGGAGGGAESAGDFEFDLDHADIAFGLVVVEGDAEVVGEGEDFGLTAAEAFEEVAGFGFFASPGFLGAWGRGRRWGAFLIGTVEEGAVLGVNLGETIGGQGGEALGFGVVDAVFGGEEEGAEGGGPGLVVLLVGEDEFAEVMGVAEGVATVVVEISVPMVVNGGAGEGGENGDVVHGFAAAFGVDFEVGEIGGGGGVEPLECAVDAAAGFVEVDDVSVGEACADVGDAGGGGVGGVLDEVVEGGGAALSAVEVVEELGGAVVREELVDVGVDGGAVEAGAILGGSFDVSGEGGAVAVVAVGTGFDVGLVFGDVEFNWGKIEDLAFFLAVGGLVGEVGATMVAARDGEGDNDIGAVDGAEGGAEVTGLTAGATLAAWTTALGLTFAEAVRGRGLAAVTAVGGEAGFEVADAVVQGSVVGCQRRDEGEGVLAVLGGAG